MGVAFPVLRVIFLMPLKPFVGLIGLVAARPITREGPAATAVVSSTAIPTSGLDAAATTT